MGSLSLLQQIFPSQGSNPSLLHCSQGLYHLSHQGSPRIPLKAKVKLLSRVRFFATPWTVAYQAPLSMGFSRQEYWSGVPLPSPGDLTDPGIEPQSPAFQADALTSEPSRKLRKRKLAWGQESQTATVYSSHEFREDFSRITLLWPHFFLLPTGIWLELTPVSRMDLPLSPSFPSNVTLSLPGATFSVLPLWLDFLKSRLSVKETHLRLD